MTAVVEPQQVNASVIGQPLRNVEWEAKTSGAAVYAGDVTPHVSQTFPLAEAAKAQEASRTGKTRGKIVLKVE